MVEIKEFVISHIYYFMIAIVILIYLFSFLFKVFSNKKYKNYQIDNPNAVKVMIDSKELLIYSRKITVYRVNNEKVKRIYKGLKEGFYTDPGENIINLSYYSERPGFFSRKVKTYTDPVDIKTEFKPGKEYFLYFDTNEEKFIFKEVN